MTARIHAERQRLVSMMTTADSGTKEVVGDSSCAVLRLALSLGLLLGMSHGWVMAEANTSDQPTLLNPVQIVNSNTEWSPSGSDSYQGFPY